MRQDHGPFIIVVVSVFICFGVLIFFINKSNTVKDEIIRANAVDYGALYSGAVFHTSMGDIEIEFLKKEAPKAVYNFITLAEKHFYDKTKFHYVLKDFLIQGGDPLSRGDNVTNYGTGGPGYTLEEEVSDTAMVRGVVAMAKVGKRTSGSQFFIITAPELVGFNGQFTAFAKVTNGLDILDRINNALTNKHVPKYPITINQIEIK